MDESNSEQAVFVYVPLSDDSFGSTDELVAIQRLHIAIDDAVGPLGGEAVGHDLGAGEAVIYVHGPDADALTDAIRVVVTDIYAAKVDAYAIKHYGPEDDSTARRERVALT